MGTIQSFLVTWTGMTAAMMAPSILPFLMSFVGRVRRRPLPVAVLAITYLAIWAAFGVAVYVASGMIDLMLPTAVAAGIAIALVGLYALTPFMRLGQAQCIAMCRRSEPIAGQTLRAAVKEGATYAAGCVACSAGVMLALVLLGMSNVLWMAAGAGLILLYKIAGRWPRRLDAALSVTLAIAGIWLLLG